MWSALELDRGALEGTSGSFPVDDGYSFVRVVTRMGTDPAMKTWETKGDEDEDGSAAI